MGDGESAAENWNFTGRYWKDLSLLDACMDMEIDLRM